MLDTYISVPIGSNMYEAIERGNVTSVGSIASNILLSHVFPIIIPVLSQSKYASSACAYGSCLLRTTLYDE